ncbi:MAG TPA: hypothetical protein VF166_13980 [Gemmatimonadaceae bacterium]
MTGETFGPTLATSDPTPTTSAPIVAISEEMCDITTSTPRVRNAGTSTAMRTTSAPTGATGGATCGIAAPTGATSATTGGTSVAIAEGTPIGGKR